MSDIKASAPRTPRTTEQALALLDRWAALDADLAAIETERQNALASTNAVADTLASPVLLQKAAIAACLESWWTASGHQLTDGKRKSIEFGGCMIGTRLGRATLDYANGDSAAAARALQEQRWAKPYIRVTYAVDGTATLKALEGAHAEKLGELGFKARPGENAFFVKRVAQDGVVAGVQAR